MNAPWEIDAASGAWELLFRSQFKEPPQHRIPFIKLHLQYIFREQPNGNMFIWIVGFKKLFG